jgi:DNA-binding transcriptional LysR family regulator
MSWIHECRVRTSTTSWEFEKDGRELKVRVEGQLVFNSTAMILRAGLAGFGLAYLPEDLVRPYVTEGRLVLVLDDWCPPFSGYVGQSLFSRSQCINASS